MKKALLTMCLLVLTLVAFAFEADTLTIHDNQSYLLTNRYFKELQATNGHLTINQVLNNASFHPITSTLPALRFSKSVMWLKFTVKNNSTEPLITFNIDASVIDEFDAYYTGGDNLLVHHQNPDHTQNISFLNCPIPPGNTATIYLRVKSNAPGIVPVKVYTESAFLQSRNVENITNGVIIGVFIVMALYNLCLFFIVADYAYLYYVGYIILMGLNQLLRRGFGGSILNIDITFLNNYLIPLVRSLLGCSILLFIGDFLQIRQNLSQGRKYFKLLYLPFVLAAVLILIKVTSLAYNLITAGMAITSVSLLIIGTYLYFQERFKPAKFFMLAWGLFFASILVSVGRSRGFIPYNTVTTDIVVYSSVLELILFSAALAEKINYYRYLKNESQNFALTVAKENERLITQQNILLENKVKERTDELIKINQSLSSTIENLTATQKQLIEHEKMASLGQLTAGVAHEINNPINFVSSNIAPLRLDFNELFTLLHKYEEAIQNPTGPGIQQKLQDYKQLINLTFIKEEISTLLSGIEEGANRTAEIVDSLRTFSSTDEQALKTDDINKSILNNLLILRNTIPYYIEIKPVFDRLEPLNCYPGKINQLIINLINNSVYAIKAKELHHDESIMIITKDYPEHISLTVTDTGIGMTEQTRQRIFEPFFTTKGIGEGTGLGLSIVFGIIEKHRGNISVSSAPGSGATFTVTLPKNLT